MDLTAILRVGTPERLVHDLPPSAPEVLAAMARLYEAAGFVRPWIGYLALEGGACVGTCAFKSAPRDGSVEIAYFSFPGNEGRGVATRMAAALIAMARRADPQVAIKAQTLPEENASTAVLRKLGFEQVGVVEHPEDGTVWEWRLGNGHPRR
jgi:[ribosomal protein S5]-alanine N-acetyltransferase